VAPRERHVLAEQRAVLLPRERRAAQELHRRRRGSGEAEEFVVVSGDRKVVPVIYKGDT
jgi:hypothetical protein